MWTWPLEGALGLGPIQRDGCSLPLQNAQPPLDAQCLEHNHPQFTQNLGPSVRINECGGPILTHNFLEQFWPIGQLYGIS